MRELKRIQDEPGYVYVSAWEPKTVPATAMRMC